MNTKLGATVLGEERGNEHPETPQGVRARKLAREATLGTCPLLEEGEYCN